MNETIKTLLNRRSIRKFKSDAVSKEGRVIWAE